MVRGNLQTAPKLGAQGLKLAERAQDPALLLAAHVLLGIALFYSGEFVSAQEQLEKVIARYDPEKHHAVAYRYAYDPGVTSLSMTVIILALLGYPERALKKIQETLTLAQQLSHPFSLSFALALETGRKNKECVCEAELYRFKGELTLQKSQVLGSKPQVDNPQLETEACFQNAIEIARRQQAKLWELRAAMSLARLWQQQGKKTEARQMPAEIYDWFTEGFDTKDLQEAKTLLDEIA